MIYFCSPKVETSIYGTGIDNRVILFLVLSVKKNINSDTLPKVGNIFKHRAKISQIVDFVQVSHHVHEFCGELH